MFLLFSKSQFFEFIFKPPLRDDTFLTFKQEYKLCDDPCPKPLPFTAWSCNCRFGSTYGIADTENEGDCNCADQKPRRFNVCYDHDLADDITCSSVAADMKRDYPLSCLISEYTRVNNPVYVTTKPVIPAYSPTLFEAWYSRTNDAVYSDATNWYQLATNWISPEELDVPWRDHKLIDISNVGKAFKGDTDDAGLGAALENVMTLVAGSDNVRISVADLTQILRQKSVIDRRNTQTMKPVSPLSRYGTQFVSNVANLNDANNAIYRGGSESPKLDRQLIIKNPCHLDSDGLQGGTFTINSFIYEQPRYTLFPVSTAAATSIQISFDMNAGDVKAVKALNAILRFVLYNFSPMDIGYQENSCREVTGTVTQWAQWSACPAQCGGFRERTRKCSTSNNDMLIWSTLNSQWEFEVAPATGYTNACFCSGETGFDSEQCGEVCKYAEWGEWNGCTIDGAAKACSSEGEHGEQKRTRALTCGIEERCCGKVDTRACYIPVCRTFLYQ